VCIKELSKKSVRFYLDPDGEPGIGPAEYSGGCAVDLNGDKIDDFVFSETWMGNGLNAAGYDVHFVMSDGKGGRKKTVIGAYGADFSDLVEVHGRIYFRHSMFIGALANSKHNHWVYQMFSFNKDGTLRRANSDFGNKFPAATIYYDKARFKRVQLTADDLRLIAEETKPVSKE